MNDPVSATLSSSAPPVGKPDPMSPPAGLSITISGGTAGQHMNLNVAVYLNTSLAVVPDTAPLIDVSGVDPDTRQRIRQVIAMVAITGAVPLPGD